MTDEQMDTRCYSKTLKSNCADPKCIWSPSAQCKSKSSMCRAISDDKECGEKDAKASNCAWSAAEISYTCETRMASQDEKCGKYNNHDGCTSEPGCDYSKNVEDFYGDVGGEVGFTGDGDGAAIFTDCFQFDSAQQCEKATAADASGDCGSDAGADKPKTAEECKKVLAQDCSITMGCKVAETKDRKSTRLNSSHR